MHCRYFAETKTLWEHLNSSADTFQFGAIEATHSCVMLRLTLLPAFRQAPQPGADRATTRCWPRLIVPGTVSFLTWHGSHIHPTMQKFLVAGYGWSLTLPRETALSSPLGRSPQWGGAQDTWPHMTSSSCWCLCQLVLGLSLNLGTWTSTCEWTLRGWVSFQCIVNATSCCLAGNHVVRMSHVSGWHNSFAACFCLYCDTVGFHHCVLGKSFVVFLLGSGPVGCLLCCLSNGKTQIWLGDLRLALFLVFCVLVVFLAVICQASCDHRRPCSSFLTNSFVSCKDRALERDRPDRRKKNHI